MTSKTERMIHGICSTERVVDHSRASDGSNNQVLLARGCALATPVPLLLEHSGDVVGRVIHLRRIEDKIYCRAIIHDDRVWQKIERCELRGLSIGVTHQHYVIKMRAEEGIVRYYDQFTINEVSLTNQPANRDCYCRIYLGGFEGRVAGQRPLSEIRKICDRAREVLKRVDQRSASQAKEKKSAARKELSASPRRDPLAPGKERLSPAERRRFDNWYQNSFTDDVGDA